MEIRQKTLEKAVAYLNEVNEEVKRGNVVKTAYVANRYHVSHGLMKSAVQIGLFKKIGNSKYVSHIATITPIIARRVIENEYKTTGFMRPEIVNKKPTTKSPKKLGTPKTKSYFWGLIKITY